MEMVPGSPASKGQDRGYPHRWKPGQSGNPEGRRAEQAKRVAEARAIALPLPETHEAAAERRLTAALAAKVDVNGMAELLLALCYGLPMFGIMPSLPAIKYVYDRIEGLPVQRHEAKLQSQVDETARILAERYGMSVAEVQARARALAAGT